MHFKLCYSPRDVAMTYKKRTIRNESSGKYEKEEELNAPSTSFDANVQYQDEYLFSFHSHGCRSRQRRELDRRLDLYDGVHQTCELKPHYFVHDQQANYCDKPEPLPQW